MITEYVEISVVFKLKACFKRNKFLSSTQYVTYALPYILLLVTNVASSYTLS